MSPNPKVTPQVMSDLRRGLVEALSLDDIKNLCGDLGVDYENLSGEGKEAKARELILFLNRRGRVPEIIAYCQNAFPFHVWPEGEPEQTGSSPNDRPPYGTPGKDTILFLAAEPSNTNRLRLGEELREIQEKLQLAHYRDRFDLQQRLSVRPADISQALLDLRPRFVHFSGHGSSKGRLCFEDEQGTSKLVDGAALAALFAQFKDHVECVLLNACYSEKQAQAIAEHIPYVIGMNKAINDRAAIAFTVGFYQALAAGRSIPDAFELGCVQIRLQGILDHLTPTLLTQKP